MYKYTFGGLKNIYLLNGYEIRETPHGEAVSFVDGEGLERAICDALATKKGKLTGTELRYLRTSGLKMSQAGLAKILEVNVQSVARWEKNGRAPNAPEKLLRIYYRSAVNGNMTAKAVIESINTLERAMVQQTIVLKESRGTWNSKFKELEAA
ncbi:MAG: helix-turn-helix domain-containing protein [Gallionellaceae bacterium]|jgi:DNA-binding transcriptional regulator YiaG|nr:helix-turn-helix domain-containing protein [Gallionellaceae bacterium]